MKMLLIFLSLFLMINLIWLPRKVHASTNPIFTDNFSTPNWQTRWQIVRNQQWQYPLQPCLFAGFPAQWQIQNHFLDITIDGPSCVTEIVPFNVDVSKFSKYTFSFDWLFSESISMDRNVVFQWQDTQNWYGLKIFGTDTLIQKVVHGQTYRLNNGTVTYPFSPNSLYHFKITFDRQKEIVVEINNDKVLETSDQPPFLSGYQTIGLQASVGAAQRSLSSFGNILVEALENGHDFQLQVPLFKQTDDRWKNLEYDSAHLWAKHPTIANWGCALASITMILRFHGIHFSPNGSEITPTSLNNWLETQIDGYVGNGLLNWLAITRLTRLINEKFQTPKLEYQRVEAHVEGAKTEIMANRPVILGIPGHFFVGNGVSEGGRTLFVLDPFYSYTHFDQYQQPLTSLHEFHPSFTDLSYFLIVHSPQLHITLKDANGISLHSTDNEDFLTNDSDRSEHTSPIVQTLFPKPSNGVYTIQVSQTNAQSSTFSLYTYDRMGNVEIKQFSGTYGQTPTAYTFNFKKVDMFQKFADDLKGQYESGALHSLLMYQRLDHIVRYALISSRFRQAYYAKVLEILIQKFSNTFTNSASSLLLGELNDITNSYRI